MLKVRDSDFSAPANLTALMICNMMERPYLGDGMTLQIPDFIDNA